LTALISGDKRSRAERALDLLELGCPPEVSSRAWSGQLSCREVYLPEPSAIGDDELICDIALPVGDEVAAAS
jgi:hypothetical protein